MANKATTTPKKAAKKTTKKAAAKKAPAKKARPRGRREQVTQEFIDWIETHPSPECRSYGHLPRHVRYEIPGRPFYVEIRYCGRGCGCGHKRIMDSNTHQLLATFDHTYGDDYRKPGEFSEHFPGHVDRKLFMATLPIETDAPPELIESVERWEERH